MPGFLDRLGKAAQQTAAEGRIRLEIHNLQSRLNDRAQALGYLMLRQHRGETIPEEKYVELLEEMTKIDSERQAKEVELEDLRRPAEAPSGGAASAAARAEVSITCACGVVNPASARFCTSCGSPLKAT